MKDKRKLFPIIVAFVIVLIGIIVYMIKTHNDNRQFSKLVVTYKESVQTYTAKDLSIDYAFVINNTTFWIKSINKSFLVLNSVDEEELDGKKTNEYKINLGKTHSICFSTNNCVYFNLN